MYLRQSVAYAGTCLLQAVTDFHGHKTTDLIKNICSDEIVCGDLFRQPEQY